MDKRKIVQSIVTAFNEQAKIIEAVKNKLNSYKTKFQNHNPDLTNTNLSTQNVSDMNTYITDLNTLCDLPIVITMENKDIPSHDIKGLD